MSTPAKTRDWTSPDLDHPVVNYRAADGIAVIEMDDPPANTYTYAMNAPARRGDPQGALRRRRARHRPARQGRPVLLRRREHRHAQRRHAGLQVLLLPARQRDAAAPRAHAQARDRGAERPHGRRRPRDRDGGGPAHRAQGRRARSACRRSRSACCPGTGGTTRLAQDGRQVARRSSSWSPATRSPSRRPSSSASSTRSSTRRPRSGGSRSWTTPASSCRRTRRRRPSAASSARSSRGWDLPLESALAIERELQQLLFQSEDAKEGIAANQEKRVPKFKGK